VSAAKPIPRYTRIFGVLGLVGLALGVALAFAASVPILTFWTFSAPAFAIAGIHFMAVTIIKSQKKELASNLPECRVFWATSAVVLLALAVWILSAAVL